MSIEIQVEVGQAQGKVDGLARGLDSIADAAEKAQSALDTLKGTDSAFADILKSVNPLTGSLASMVEGMKALTESMSKQQAVADALTNVHKAIDKSTATVTETIKQSSKAIAENANQNISAAKALGKVAAAEDQATGVAQRYIDALEARNNAMYKSHLQLLKMKGGYDDLDQSVKDAGKRQVELAENLKVVGKYITPQTTKLQELQAAYKSLEEVRKEGLDNQKTAGLSTQQYETAKLRLEELIAVETAHAKSLANLQRRYGPLETEVTKYALSLRKLVDEMRFGDLTASQMQGWDKLSQTQQKNILTTEKQAEAFKRLNTAWSQSSGITALQDHMQKLQALQTVMGAKNSDNQFIISTEQYLAKLAELDAQLRKNMQTEQASVKVKNEVITAAQKRLAVLRSTNTLIPLTNRQQAERIEGFNKLTTAEKAELVQLIKVENAMKRLGQEYTKSLTPMDKYVRKLKDISIARAEHIRTGGAVGVSALTAASMQKSMAAEFVKTEFAARRATKGLLGFAGGLNVMNQATAAGRAAMMGFGQSFGIFTGSTILVAASVYGLAKAITSSVKVGAEFELQFTRIALLMVDVDDAMQGAALTSSAMAKGIKAEMRRLAENTQFNLLEVADATSILVRSGMSALQVYGALESVLDLAAVGMMEMGKAADIATGVMASFSLTAGEFADVVDTLAIAANKSKASVEDIGQSMKFIGPIASQLGLDVEGTVAAIGKLSDVNIRGSQAGTSLRRIFINLMAPSKQAAEVMAKYGIEVDQATFSTEKFIGVLHKLRSASVGELKAISGQYAISALTALVNPSALAEMEKMVETLRRTEGYAVKIRNELRQGFSLTLEQVGSQLQNIQQAAFDAFGPALTQHLRDLSSFLQQNQQSISDLISMIVNAGAKLLLWAAEWHEWIVKGTIAFGAWKVFATVLRGIETAAIAASIAMEALAARQALVAAGGGMGVAGAAGGVAAQSSNAFRGLGVTVLPAASNTTKALSGLSKVLASTLKGLSTFVGFLLGPWGIALTAAGLILYQLTDGFAFLKASAGESAVKLQALLPTMANMISESDNLTASAREAADALSTIRLEKEQLNITTNIENITSDIQKITDQQDEYFARLVANQARIEKAQSVLNNPYASEGAYHSAVTALNSAYRERTHIIEQMGTNTENLAKRTEDLNIQNAALQGTMGSLDFRNIEKMGKLAEDFKRYRFEAGKSTEAMQAFWELITKDYFKGLTDDTVESAAAMGNFQRALKAALGDIITEFESLEEKELFTTQLENVISAVAHLSPEVKTHLALAGDDFKKFANTTEESLDKFSVNMAEALKVFGSFGLDTTTITNRLITAYKMLQGATVKNTVTPTGGSTKNPILELLKEAEKLTPSLEQTIKKLNEYNEAQAGISSGSKGAIAALKELGLSSSEAADQLNLLGKDLVLTSIENELAKVDPRFRGLKKILEGVAEEEYNAEQATEALRASLSALERGAPGILKQFGGLEGAMAKYSKGTKSVVDGTRELEKKLKEIAKQAAVVEASFRWESFDDYIKSLEEVNGALEEKQIRDIALIRLGAEAGDVIKGMASDQELMAEYTRIATLAIEDEATALRVIQHLREKNTVEGRLERSNRELQEQVGLVYASAAAQQLYAIRMKATENGLKEWTAGAERAAIAQVKLTQEIERMSQMRQAMEQFRDGTLGAFADLFSGIEKSFGGTVKKIRDLFKNLLREMIYNAMRNRIVFNMGTNAQGGSMGSSMGSMIGSMFGGGGGGGGGGGMGGGLLSGLSGAISSGVAGGLTSLGGFISGGASVGFGAGLSYAGSAIASGGLLSGMASSFGAGASMMTAGGAGAILQGIGAMIPMIGAVIAVAALIDKFSGGKLFGTKYKFDSASRTFDFAGEGVDGYDSVTQVRNRSLFRGRKWNTINSDLDPEIRGPMEDFWEAILHSNTQIARQFGRDAAIDVPASFKQEFDKDGNVIKEIGTILGKQYTEAWEVFAKRIAAENIIANIDGIMSQIGGGGGDGGGGGGGGNGPPGLSPDFQVVMGTVSKTTAIMGEASAIAERWRHDAELLMDGANFLLLAATDLRKGFGLLGDGSLTAITDLIEGLQNPGETLVETYSRVATSTALLEQAISISGVTLDKTREEFVIFATEIAEAAGGVEKATALWQGYFNAFYSAAELAAMKSKELEKTATASFSGIGQVLQDFTGEGGLAAFREAFETALPTLTPEQAALWLEAGNALANFTAPMREIDELLKGNAWDLYLEGLSASDRAIAELNQKYDAYQQTLIENGASLEQLAILEGQRGEALDRLIAQALTAYNELGQGIADQLAEALGASDYQREMVRIDRALQNNIRSLNEAARAAGMQAARETDLARAHQLAAVQAANALAALESAARGIAEQLYGTPLSRIDDQIAALREQESAIHSVGEGFQQVIRDASEAMGLLLGQYSPLRAVDKLPVAMDALRRGETDANTVLGIARDVYGSGRRYNEIFAEVMQYADRDKGTGMGAGGSPGTTISAEMRALLDEQAALKAEADQKERFGQATQLADMMAQLQISMGLTWEELAEKLGFTMGQLSADLGMDEADLAVYLEGVQDNQQKIADLYDVSADSDKKLEDILEELRDLNGYLGDNTGETADATRETAIAVTELARVMDGGSAEREASRRRTD